MQINPDPNRSIFVIRSRESVNNTGAVALNNQVSPEIVTPQSQYHGPVSQLINSRYLYELRKDSRKIFRGRKLKEILDYDYSLEEFENLPPPLRNLVKFDRTISSAEILQFMEAFDQSHEINFRDYSFDRVKFRALFAALGEFLDVEMQVGPSTFMPLSDEFEIKKKIKEVFLDLKNKFANKLLFKKGKKANQQEIPELNEEDEHSGHEYL